MARDGSSLHALARDIPLVWPKANEAHIIFGSGFALMRPGRERLSLASTTRKFASSGGFPDSDAQVLRSQPLRVCSGRNTNYRRLAALSRTNCHLELITNCHLEFITSKS
jgi:hypothetical protein